MRLFLALALALCTLQSASQPMPTNAHKAQYGSGWECNRGFRQVGIECQKVVIPANAGLDILGHDWECNRGFQRTTGNECQRVVVPKNAGLDVLGHDWECIRGYQRVGGNECQKVVVPPNGVLDVLGHDWTCKKGFKRVVSECQALTESEKKQEADQEKAIRQEIKRRQTQGVSGNHCSIELQSGARVCLTVRDAHLNCSESYSREYYDRCQVDVTYTVETDHRGNGFIDGRVHCDVSLNTSGARGGSSKLADESNSFTVMAFGSTSGTMDVTFSLSSYDEVNKVKISDVSCRVENLFLF